MADHHRQYEKKIRARYKFGLKGLKRGHIIEIEYGDKKDLHIVFVLTPKWEGKLHGIKLNEVPYNQFKRVLDRFKTENEVLIREAVGEMRAPTDMSIKQPKQFYRTYFKPSHLYDKFKPYRTYLHEEVKKVILIDFNYGKIDDVDNLPIPGSKLKFKGR